MLKPARPCCWCEGGEVAKLERVAPPEFGGNLATLEKMLVDALEGPHPEWTPQDLEDIHGTRDLTQPPEAKDS